MGEGRIKTGTRPGDASRWVYAGPQDGNGIGNGRLTDRVGSGAEEKRDPLDGCMPVYGPVYGEENSIREGIIKIDLIQIVYHLQWEEWKVEVCLVWYGTSQRGPGSLHETKVTGVSYVWEWES